MSEPRGFVRPATRTPRDVPDDAVLTQYGRQVAGQETFRSSPRFPNEHDLSLLWGEMPPGMASLAVRGRRGDASDRVRTCTAGALRAAGFVVQNTPSLRNPDHISVTVPGGHLKWDDGQAKAFETVMQAGRP
jgi:hypothetical protein